MRKPLLMSTVALLAGLAVASAQQMPGGDGQRGAAQKQERGVTTSAQKEQSREGEAGRSKGAAQGKQGERAQQGKSGESKSSTTGQGGRQQSKQAEPQKDKQGQQAERGKAEQGKQAGEAKSGTTGQSAREQQGKQAGPQNGQKGKQAERGKAEQGKQGNEPKSSTTGQSEREPGRQAGPKTDRQGQTGQARQGGETTGQARGSEQGSVQLSNEQRTQIREQVLTRNAPRVDNVNFSVRVGTTVPTSVRIVEVPDVLIRIHPEWRGHRYFVVRDEIVIVDNSHRIVSVVPVGSSGAQLDNSGRGSVSVRTGGAMSLSVEEIREVQQVLVRDGFDVEIDGKLGPKTREALISFQRRNGLQASGRIDTQTVTKLGVNVRGGQGGSGQSTTGQGGSRDNQGNMPSREQGQQGRQDQQGGDRNNQRSEQNRSQDRNANTPSTTGQGGQQGSERGNMPKSQQDGSQNRTSNRDREK